MNNYIWLIRREIWERRSIWMVPGVIGGLVILIASFGKTMFIKLDEAPVELSGAGSMYLVGVGALFAAVMALCVVLYYLDCLYDDRRDRSILFWKSLPISDTDTVLSKLVMGMLIFPLVYYFVAECTALITAVIISIRAHSAVGTSLWQVKPWLQIQVLWLWLMVSSAIWYLPVVGFLLLLSATVKRAPLLWAILPFLVAYLLEHFFLGTHYIMNVVGGRLGGYPLAAFHTPSGFDKTQSLLQVIDVRGFFSSPPTWIGAAVGVAMIVGTIQLRMRRSEV